MELILKPNNAQYRLVIRDEITNKSKSIGIYNTSYDLNELILLVKQVLEDSVNEEKLDNGLWRRQEI